MILFDEDKQMFHSTLVDANSILAGFGTRQLCNALSKTEITSYFSQQRIQYKQFITLEQIHSTNISVISSIEGGNVRIVEESDGVVTTIPDVLVSVRTADCIPIIYIEHRSGIIGISHNGWRGTLKHLQKKMIETMVSFGAVRDSIVVALGPGINQCCYAVDEDRYYEFKDEAEAYCDAVFRRKNNTWHLNMLKLNYLLLREAGIREELIDYFPFCTSCDKERFFSFRREGKKNLQGEMLSFISRV